MSEIARLILQLRKLDSLLFRSNLALRQESGSASLAINVQGLEAMQRQLKRRFEALAAKEWLDVCNYRFRPGHALFVPIKQITDALGGFQTAVGITADAIVSGRPKDRGTISKAVADESALRFAFTEGGPEPGEFGFNLLVENRRELLEPVEESVSTIFEMAQATDSDVIHTHSQRLGPAPIRALSDWCHFHVKAGLESSVGWTRDSLQTKFIHKSPEQWRSLKETIELVSDSLTEEIRIRGVLIAANVRTRAFVIEAPNETIHGKFADDVISRTRAAQVPKDYHFTLQKTMRRNYAMDRITTEYKLTGLEAGHD
jgi:hypothetical protein